MKYLEPAAMILSVACAFGAGVMLPQEASAQVREPEGRRASAQCLVQINGEEIEAEGCPRVSFSDTMQSVEVRITLDYWRAHPGLIELGKTYRVGVAFRQPYREDVVEVLYRGVEITGRAIMVQVVEMGKAGDHVRVRVQQ